jgi:signal transduction histidine kinase
MSWSTIIWSMSAAVCLTLAAVHFIVWSRMRDSWGHLLFSVAAVSTAVIAMLELNLIHVKTPEAYGELLRWMHVPAGILMVALVWFIYFYLQAGRRWLAWTITGLRMLILLPNFLIYPNATFAEITGLRSEVFFGEIFSIPIGEENPWRILIHVSMLLWLLFVLDAAITAWKQGRTQRALVLAGMTILAILLGAISSGLMARGILPSAFVSFIFMLIVLVMAFELSMDLIRSRELAHDLHESQQRMNLAASAANLGLWEWDVIRDAIWISETGRDRLGISVSRHMNLDDYLQMIHFDDRESTRLAISHTLEGRGDFQAEYRMVKPNDTTRWIAARGQVECGVNGKPLLLRGVSMDITERKQAENELQKHRDELAHISRVSALGQLSSSLAHEINQPLGAILRNAEAAELFLKQTPPDLEEVQEILKDIRNDEQRAVSVIERMRLLLKRRELQLEALVVNQLISEVAKLLSTEFQMHHASLHIAIEDGLPDIYGDHVHLQQVVLNLLLNSLDALNGKSEGQRQIVIRASQTMDGMVEFAVVDCGTGVAPEQLSHLFEPFYTTKKNGTGIGLAISKTIVEMHGGAIMAMNNPDGGTTVRFTVKVAPTGEEQL